MQLNADSYVAVLSEEMQPQYVFREIDKEGFESWQQAFRAELAKALGLDTIKQRGSVPLDPVKVGCEQLSDHTREEFEITTELGFRLSFYVLRPLGDQIPKALVITPHGHSKDGKDTYVGIYKDDQGRRSIIDGERDIALQAVREGYMAIAPDMRGFTQNMLQADKTANRSNSCRTMQMHALLFGRTLLGERVWDMLKVVDFAISHLNIDRGNIVITGNSGGGTVSLYAAALDPRIGICIPSCCYCSFEASWGAVHHCECGYVPGIMKLGNMYDIAGLVGPRPLLIVAGRDDPLAPIDETKKAFANTRHIYEVIKAEYWCQLYIGHGGHRYYKEPVWPFVKKALQEHQKAG